MLELPQMEMLRTCLNDKSTLFQDFINKWYLNEPIVQTSSIRTQIFTSDFTFDTTCPAACFMLRVKPARAQERQHHVPLMSFNSAHHAAPEANKGKVQHVSRRKIRYDTFSGGGGAGRGQKDVKIKVAFFICLLGE